jgi:3-deoxy-manno-octulosonate cytidylyltransferase (CMP-KDO synthetase)
MFRVVIPARYGSSRLMGKPLAMIGDKPMIQWVYENAVKSHADSIVIATDDARIEKIAKSLGADVFLSDIPHNTGTERIAEVVEVLGYDDDDIIVNLQGDQPFLQGELVKQAAELLAQHDHVFMSTLYIPMPSHEEVFNPNTVKLVLDKEQCALYFSRAPIPWLRDEFTKDNKKFDLSIFHQHIGVYAYRAHFIKKYITLSESPIEHYESLEQLRVIWNGYKIIAASVKVIPGQEVNTPEDLDKAQVYARERA